MVKMFIGEVKAPGVHQNFFKPSGSFIHLPLADYQSLLLVFHITDQWCPHPAANVQDRAF